MRLAVGDRLGPLEHGPITTRQLVEYAGASLDFNRVHYDEPFARAGGHPSVIVHGMLSMAFLGQLVARVAGPAAIVALRARFKGVCYPGDVLTVTGEVTSVEGALADVKLVATRADGSVTLEGSATLSMV